MIIAWVLSLLLLLASLVHHLERLTALEVISVSTYLKSHHQFIANEKALFECEHHLPTLSQLENTACHVQSAGKNLWLISTKEKPVLEVLVFLDKETNLVTRLNWRQQFE